MTQPPQTPPTQSTPVARGERHLYRASSDALTEIMARPGWVDALLDTPDGTDLHTRHLVWGLIIRLFKVSIERQGTALAAQWRRERDQRGRMRLMRGGRERQSRVRLIKGRRVRCSLRARRRASPPVTGPRAT